MPGMKSFVKFLGDIWEREETTLNMAWIEERKRQLNEKFSQVNLFNITFGKVRKKVEKRKRWATPAIDGIHNCW